MREGRAITHNISKLHLKEVQGLWLETEHTPFSSMSSEPVMCNFSLEVKEQNAYSLLDGICLPFAECFDDS